jgi:hypothetical protein
MVRSLIQLLMVPAAFFQHLCHAGHLGGYDYVIHAITLLVRDDVIYMMSLTQMQLGPV